MRVSGSYNYNITIVDEREGTGTGKAANPSNPVQEGAPNKRNPTQAGSKDTALHMALNGAERLGKQAVNSAISNIGLATGNYTAQRNAQAVSSLFDTSIGLGSSIVTGNIALAAISIGAMAINLGNQYYQAKKQTDINNKIAEQYARRAGFSSYRNR